MLLCTAIATAFTACDSLIPNDPSTEEENTQGGNGNDNPGGSDGAEDEGGSGNNEEEDPTPEMKGCNPCVNFGRLVKEMISTTGSNNIHWIFEYDEYGRYFKVTEKNNGICITDFVYSDNSFSFTYGDSQFFVCTTDDNGYITAIDYYTDNYHNQVIYTYENGFIVKTEEYSNSDDGKPFGLIWTSECEWEDGNLKKGGLSYFMDGDTYSYTEHEDKMSIWIYDTDLPLRFKGVSNRNLLQIYDNYLSYTYTLDEDGYILSMEDNYDSYVFTYYE